MDPWTLGPLDYFLDYFFGPFSGPVFSTIDSWGGVGRSFSSFVSVEVGIVTLVTLHLHFKANAID